MASTQYAKAKGRNAENAVVEWLKQNGYRNAERRRLAGAADRGDIAGVYGVVIEVKAEKRINLAGYVDEANIEAVNDGAELGVAWVKRRGKTSPGDWYVVMDGATFTRMVKEWHDGRTPF